MRKIKFLTPWKIIVALVFVVASVLVVVFSLPKINTSLAVKNDSYISNEQDSYEVISRYKKATIPETMDVLYDKYPFYRTTNTFTEEEKLNIIAEEEAMFADLLDTIYNGQLKRHPFADRQFNNNSTIDYSCDRTNRLVTINPLLTDWRAIGYALPGEVVTISFPTGMDYSGISLNIGMGNTDQNIPAGAVSKWNNNRMPILSKNFSLVNLSSYIINDTFKIGSPLGGMIYINTNGSPSLPFSVQVSGGVDAPIYTFGQTTNEEWESLRNSSGLMAEIRMSGLRLVMTANHLRNVKNIEEVASFWYKAISLSENALGLTGKSRPITMMFDYRVDAGAAVAFVGAWYCQLPDSWADTCVNYASIIKSGMWGNLHEMNHHMQGTYNVDGRWGLAGANEVTNNVMTSLTYILYTDIALYRTENGGLNGWNYVSDPYSTMKTVYAGSDDSLMLRTYISLAHAFGVNKFVDFVRAYYSTWYSENYATTYSITRDSTSAFCLLASKVFQMDMRYFCSIFGYTIQENVATAIENMKLKTFYPIFNLYTMGYNGVSTGRPFTIPAGKTYTFDFGEYMAIEPTKNYQLKVSGFSKGKVKKISDLIYQYTPGSSTIEDNFTLTVILSRNNQIKLTGKIIVDKTYVNTEKYVTTKSDMDQAIDEINGKTPTSISASNILGLSNYNDSEKSLNIISGKLFFKKSGYYTLFVLGDDKCRLLVDSGSGLAKVGETTAYSGSYQKTTSSTYKTLYFNANQLYSFVLYNLNTGGQGSARVGYVFDGDNPLNDYSSSSIINIGSENIANSSIKNVTELVKKDYFTDDVVFSRPLRNLNTSLRVSYNSNMEVLSVPKGANDTSSPTAMLDGNNSTFYHTSYPGNGGATQFPADFIFKINDGSSFNYLNITTRRSSDAMGKYEIYAGNKLESLKLIKSGTNTSQNPNIVFDTLISAKYVKIRALNNVSGNSYLVFSELNFGYKANLTSFVNADDSKIISKNMLLKTSAHFTGNKALVGNGRIEFIFYGDKLGIYSQLASQYGSFNVNIDNKNMGNVSLNSSTIKNNTLVFLKSLSKGYHKVVLTSINKERFNLNFVGF